MLAFQQKSGAQLQKNGGMGDAEAVNAAVADRVAELTSCPAFRLKVFAGPVGGAASLPHTAVVILTSVSVGTLRIKDPNSHC